MMNRKTVSTVHRWTVITILNCFTDTEKVAIKVEVFLSVSPTIVSVVCSLLEV